MCWDVTGFVGDSGGEIPHDVSPVEKTFCDWSLKSMGILLLE